MTKCEECGDSDGGYGPYTFPPLNKTYKSLCLFCYDKIVEQARATCRTDMRDIKTRGKK
jgi:hypothetical protein